MLEHHQKGYSNDIPRWEWPEKEVYYIWYEAYFKHHEPLEAALTAKLFAVSIIGSLVSISNDKVKLSMDIFKDTFKWAPILESFRELVGKSLTEYDITIRSQFVQEAIDSLKILCIKEGSTISWILQDKEMALTPTQRTVLKSNVIRAI